MRLSYRRIAAISFLAFLFIYFVISIQLSGQTTGIDSSSTRGVNEADVSVDNDVRGSSSTTRFDDDRNAPRDVRASTGTKDASAPFSKEGELKATRSRAEPDKPLDDNEIAKERWPSPKKEQASVSEPRRAEKPSEEVSERESATKSESVIAQKSDRKQEWFEKDLKPKDASPSPSTAISASSQPPVDPFVQLEKFYASKPGLGSIFLSSEVESPLLSDTATASSATKTAPTKKLKPRDILADLRAALTIGTLLSESDAALSVPPTVSVIEREVSSSVGLEGPFSMIEWVAQAGKSESVSAGASVAAKFTQGTVVSVYSDPALAAAHRVSRDVQATTNNWLCVTDFVPETIADVSEVPDALFKVQLLPYLPAFVGTLLPHEFERLVGQLLTLATVSYVTVPANLPRFFSYWTDFPTLLKDSLRSMGGVQATIGKLSPAFSGGSTSDILVVNVTRLMRTANLAITDVDTNQDIFTEGTLRLPGFVLERTPLGRRLLAAATGKAKPGVDMSHAMTAVSVQVLRQLGLLSTDAARLFSSALQLPTVPTLLYTRMFVSAVGVAAYPHWSQNPPSGKLLPVAAFPVQSLVVSATPAPAPAPASNSKPADKSEIGTKSEKSNSGTSTSKESAPLAKDSAASPTSKDSASSPTSSTKSDTKRSSALTDSELNWEDSDDLLTLLKKTDKPSDKSTDDSERSSGGTRRHLLSIGEDIFDLVWTPLREDLPYHAEQQDFSGDSSSCDKSTPLSALVYGSDMSLLATKLGRSLPQASVLSVYPPYSRVTKYADVISYLQLSNVVRCGSVLNSRMLKTLVTGKQRFDVAVFGMELLQNLLLQSPMEFAALMQSAASLADTVYFHVPQADVMLHALAVFGASSAQYNEGSLKGFFNGMLSAEMDVQLLRSYGWAAMYGHVVRIRSAQSPLSKSLLAVSHKHGLSAAAPRISTGNSQRSADATSKSGSSRNAVRLSTILALQPVGATRASLFKEYLGLQLKESMPPQDIVWRCSKLQYGTTTGNKQSPRATLAATITEQLVGEKFSFMEFGSENGTVSVHVATQFPNATVLSLEGDAVKAGAHRRYVETQRLRNNMVCNQAPNSDVVGKLYECPELMRYQLLNNLQEHLVLMPLPKYKAFLGQLLSTGMTTFIDVPSPAILSLALSTFFPAQYTTRDFTTDSHPIKALENVDISMLSAASVPGGNFVKVMVQRIAPTTETIADGSRVLLRVDVLNMTRTVNHHFDYKRDGHSRKYVMRILRDRLDVENDKNEHSAEYLLNTFDGTTDTPVTLQRAEDGFVIPYERIHSITLIAVLRLGISVEQREWLYDMFVHMPLYEDMAPWNIVFDGGYLAYIDYDTRDNALDKIVPLGYQVMAALANFKRTVEDFKHCGPKGGNFIYNFPYLSECVGGHDFKGPCRNSAKPVPCGDGTCRSTYVECLRGLLDMEKALSEKSGDGDDTVADKSDRPLLDETNIAVLEFSN